MNMGKLCLVCGCLRYNPKSKPKYHIFPVALIVTVSIVIIAVRAY